MLKKHLLKRIIILGIVPIVFSCNNPIVEKQFITKYVLKNSTNFEIKIIEYNSQQNQKIIKINSNSQFDSTFISNNPELLFKGDSLQIFMNDNLSATYKKNQIEFNRNNLYKMGAYIITERKEKFTSYEFEFINNRTNTN